ncbi:MAG: accessory gene regulator B family protein, partial [Syntrophomonadaceae bacterium]|nr:accessory gene regulator B family protein [Syntrophomonadaceae bacterium]
ANEDEIAIYAYGIEILLGILIKFAIAITLALLFGILKTVLIFMFTFSLFRFLGGGVHLSTYLRCLTFGLFLVLGVGYLATILLPAPFIISLFIAAILIGIWVCVKWVPAGTEKKQVTDPQERFRQKTKFLYSLSIYVLAVTLLLLQNQPTYAQACIYASLLSSFLITPLGYSVMNTVDKLFMLLNKGGELDV